MKKEVTASIMVAIAERYSWERSAKAMTLIINLSDAEAIALQAKAENEGHSSVEAWIQKLAQQEPPSPGSGPLRNIANFIVDSMKDVSPEIMATMPTDGASQHDHYIYGWPKREV